MQQSSLQNPAENTCVTVDLLICNTGTGSLLSTWGSTEIPQASNNNWMLLNKIVQNALHSSLCGEDVNMPISQVRKRPVPTQESDPASDHTIAPTAHCSSYATCSPFSAFKPPHHPRCLSQDHPSLPLACASSCHA